MAKTKHVGVLTGRTAPLFVFEMSLMFPGCVQSLVPMTHFQTAFPHCQHTAIRGPLHSCQVLGLGLKML